MSNNNITTGIIQIEPNRWQLISIPIIYGYWDNINHKLIHDDIIRANVKNYIIDQIEDRYSISANEYIEIISTYFGDDNEFKSYIPGITNVNSTHNFPLAFFDGENIEYAAMWIKSKTSTVFTINWGSAETSQTTVFDGAIYA